MGVGWTTRYYDFYRYKDNTVLFPRETEFNDSATVLSKHNEGYHLLPIKLDKVKTEVEKFCKEHDLLFTLNHDYWAFNDLKMIEAFTMYSSSIHEPFVSFQELKRLLKEWFKVNLRKIPESIGDRVEKNFYTKAYKLEEEGRKRYRESY